MSKPVHLHISHQGSGSPVLLSHALGADMSMWDEVADLLSERYSVTSYDHRGHGRSQVLPGPYRMDDLVDDAAQLIAQHFKKPVTFIGLSMGGMVGQLLAARHPSLVRKLVLANCPSHVPAEAKTMWMERIAAVQRDGMSAVADANMTRWFTPSFIQDTRKGGAAAVAAVRQSMLSTDAEGYVAACEAVSSFDARAELGQIQAPTLVIGASQDPGTSQAASEDLQQSIPGARLRILPTAHLSAVEQPQAFADAVISLMES